MKEKALSIVAVTVVCGLMFSPCALGGEQSGVESQQSFAFSWFSLVKPAGIATLSVVSLTFLTGLLRKKLKRKFLKVHLPLAIAAVALGLSHGLLVLILYG